MIDNLKPYPEYKESGVEWLGKVPKHWRTLPAFAAYRPRLLRNTGLVEKRVLSLSYGQIIVKPPEKLRGLVPESFETYQIVDPGNIIVRTTDLQNDHTSLRVGHSAHRGIITSAYMCLETTGQMAHEFGYQFLNAYDLLKIIYGYGSGLRQNLDFIHIKRMPVLVPPLPEQRAIVRFLDHADRLIKKYIRAKQKLIKLLEEQKQAIIHRAVTRGLDPNVKLKPSGVEWLGDVPEHWGVMRLAQLILDGPRNGISPPITQNVSTIQSFSISVVRDGLVDIRPEDIKYVSASIIDRIGSYALRAGDILLVRGNGNIRFVGRAGLVGNDMPNHVYPDLLMRIRLAAEAYPQFVVKAINSETLRSQIENVAKTTVGTFKINNQHVRQFWISLPPLSEQRAINSYIESICLQGNAAIDQAHRELSLLREYRTRLIADVVTGKLDVRDAAASLPDVPEEAEQPVDVDETADEELEGAESGEAEEAEA